MTVTATTSRGTAAEWVARVRRLLKDMEQQSHDMERQRRLLEELIAAAPATSGPATPFQFYEQVRVLAGRKSHAAIVGKLGIIAGRDQGDDGRWTYAVAVEGDDTWSIDGRYLEPTGRVFTRDALYSGESVKVRVDAKGRGQIGRPERRK
jgi:hypothetical protein